MATLATLATLAPWNKGMKEKNMNRNAITIICTLVMCAAFALPAWADNNGIVPVQDFGQIDWYSQKLTAKGYGVPDPSHTAAQAKRLAQRAALADARRNLLEVIKGVYISSGTRVENFALEDDLIMSRVEGLVKGCQIEGYQMLDDGTVEATVSMYLDGDLEGTLLLESPLDAHRGVHPDCVSGYT